VFALCAHTAEGEYKVKMRSLAFNLKDENNPELREKVLLGELTPQWLAKAPVEVCSSPFASSFAGIDFSSSFLLLLLLLLFACSKQLLASKTKKEQTEKILKKTIDQTRVAGAGGTKTTQFRCGKCNQRDTNYSQMQTRSADEPMTTFVTCNNCGNKWKF